MGNYALAALKKLSVMNSRRLIAFILKIIPEIESLDFKTFSSMDKRLFQMFYVTVFKKAIEDWEGEDFNENMGVLESSPTFLQEIEELLSFNYSRIDFVDMPIDLGFDCPLDLHCSYTRDQILVALDFLKPDTVREGVKWLPEKKIDVLFITLNKAEKDYSPSTMYNDYSINDVLFHWQSQSTTSANSPTGMRYKEAGHGETKVLLFVRKEKRDPDTKKANAELYTYLGPARCKSSSGSSPMNIIWSLEHPIPARFVRTTNRLAAV